MSAKPHVILLADHLDPDPLFLMKSLGAQKVAYELRQAGYEVVLLNHLHIYEFKEICHMLRHLISDRTLFIGVSPGNYMSMVKEDNPNVAGAWGQHWRGKELGAMLPHGRQYNAPLKEFVRLCNPNVKWVVGGPDAVDLPYNRDYDYVVEGFADISVINLTRHIESGEPLRKSHRSVNGFTIIRDTRAEGFDFANSTMTWDSQDVILPDEVLSIEISRGCRFKCTFCAYPLNGRKKNDYIKREDLLYQELMTNYERFGTTKYMFVDDTFNESEEKVDTIYRISQKLPFKLEYWAYVRLDLLGAHLDQVDKLFGSGCRAAFFGVETFNQKTGSLIGKSGRRERQIETLQHIRDKFGRSVSLHVNFLVGLPYESIDSVLQTRQWLLETDLVDSFWMMPLRLRSPELVRVSDTNFVSEIDLDPEKFGYTLLEPVGDAQVAWRSEHMDFHMAKKICDEAKDWSLHKQSPEGRRLFYCSGLGYPLDDLIGRTIQTIPWEHLRSLKQDRIQMMKQQVYAAHGIPSNEPGELAERLKAAVC